jgi:hypothetical protein
VITKRVPTPPRAGVRLRALAPVFIIVVALGGSVSGCAGQPVDLGAAASAPATADAAAPSKPQVPMGAMRMPTGDEVTTAWNARPEFVEALPAQGRSAYAFALARPDVLQWLPCYCGCGGMGHRSNLDCFFQDRETGAFTFEEHASFCDICVETANLASKMVLEGRTMGQIRAAVDATFGGGAAPGTDTALPPS